MGILLSKVRIRNFRSIESMSLDLGMSNLLIGQNNTGKTNFLRAINIAVSGSADISENDIFVAQDERLEKSKVALIDIMFQPVNSAGSIIKEFSVFWTSVFTDSWVTTSTEGNFVGIRTEIRLDLFKDSYILNRRCIRQWGEDIDTATIEIKKNAFNDDMRTSLQSFYMDANRDIVQDLRNRKSYFGRVTSNYDLLDEKVREIEEQLSSVNTMIIESIPTLNKTKERISSIVKMIGTSSGTVEIEPLARKISDLNKGMDIVMQDGNAASFPISLHGSGTRSWISFLTLAAFVENQNDKLRVDDDEAEQYIMLIMEEPEAHLHPQAQRQLFEQISHFKGQKVVSTHSPSIIAQSALTDAIYFSKRDGKTAAIRYKATDTHGNEEMIFREVINTRADLLFASAVILCEGITEELALPVYFYKYFGCAPFSLGVSVINTGGQKYKQYLSLIKDFDIPWFIFSDGEEKTIQTVKTAVNDVLGLNATDLPNVVVLENGDDYEKYLIHEGYADLIVEAICGYEDKTDYLDTYIKDKNGQKRKGGIVRDYSQEDGRTKALIDLCHEHKADYALPVATKLVEKAEPKRKVPPKIKTLFSALADKIGTNKAHAEEKTE
ncbi:MAG: AAA family ATPase [Synergistaceae bacterium]|jgi:putative ATP-dependent endonuclease of OLD family|nr:AAA family ATPase [Synergistaceae bacterium]